MSGDREQWLAERYWPGLTEHAAKDVLVGLRAACTELDGATSLEIVGGTWLPDDEMLATRFTGTRAGVVAAHELAGATFDRLTRVIELGH